MAGIFGSMTLLSNFIRSTKENDRRFRTNMEAIIEKYQKPSLHDDLIDLTSLEVISSGVLLENHKPAQFGLSKLATTQRRERNQTLTCTFLDDKSSECVDKSFSSEALNESVAEENCTKVFSFICVEDNDPSDAETLASLSTESEGSWEEFSNTDSASIDAVSQKVLDENDQQVSKSWYSLQKSSSLSENSVTDCRATPVETQDKSSVSFERNIVSCNENSDNNFSCNENTDNNVSCDENTDINVSCNENSDNILGCSENSDNLTHSASLKKPLSESDYSILSSEDSVKYQTSAENSTCQTRDDQDYLLTKSEFVHAWIIEQQQNLQKSVHSTTDIKLGEMEDTKNMDPMQSAGNNICLNKSSGSSVKSDATYIIEEGNSSNLLCGTCPKNMMEINLNFLTPLKQNIKSPQSSASRRILRARKRFKQSELSMNDEQLKDFFDSPCPDFTVFYPSAEQTFNDNGVSSLQCQKKSEKYEVDDRDVIVDISCSREKEKILSESNRMRSGEKTSLKPLKLEFPSEISKNGLISSNKYDKVKSTENWFCSNGALKLDLHKSNFKCEKTLKRISTDSTVLINSIKTTEIKGPKDVLAEETQKRNVKQITKHTKSPFNNAYNKHSLKKAHANLSQTYVVNSEHSNQRTYLSRKCLTSEMNHEFACETRSLGEKAITDENYLNTPHKHLEMSPVSRLSSLRLSSPCSSIKMAAICSSKYENSPQCKIVTETVSPKMSLNGIQKFDASPNSVKRKAACTQYHSDNLSSDISNFVHKKSKRLVDFMMSAKCKNSEVAKSLIFGLLKCPEDAVDKPSKRTNGFSNQNTNYLRKFPSDFKQDTFANSVKHESVKKTICVKRLQKLTSTPVKKHLIPSKLSNFYFNETLSTVVGEIS